MKFLTLPSGLEVAGMTQQRAEILEFQTKDYFRHGIAVASGQTVIDIGANFGFFSLAVLSKTGGQCRLFSVEPASEIRSMLRLNLQRNFPSADVVVVDQAFSSVPGEMMFYFRPDAPEMSSLLKEPPASSLDLASVARTESYRQSPYARLLPVWLIRLAPGAIGWLVRMAVKKSESKMVDVPVQVNTLDLFLDDYQLTRIDLLKVDVEGSELDILDGLSADRARTIRQIVVEAHDIDGRVAKIRERLATWEFDEVVVDQELFFQGSNVFNIYAIRHGLE